MRIFPLLITICSAWFASAIPADAQDRSAPLDFGGRALVALSDADMLASAYVDGRLGPVEGEDTLSVIALGKMDGGTRPATIASSNSVAGPPAALAVTPDGRSAAVVETFGRRPNR